MKAKERDWLSWDETENTYGGIWEMETPCGRFFRIDLGGKRGLGFYAVGRIRSSIEPENKKAWNIAQNCRFRKVASLHFRVRPTASFQLELLTPKA